MNDFYIYYAMDEPMLPPLAQQPLAQQPNQMNKLPNEFLMPVPFCELVCDQLCWACCCACGICV